MCVSIQIMNVYDCNDTYLFMRWPSWLFMRWPSWMEHFIFDRIKIFVPLYDSKTFIFLVYITVQRLIFWIKCRSKKYWKIRYRSKNLHKPSVQLYFWSITRTLNHILRLLHFPSVEFCIWSFLLASTLKQSSEDCIGMEYNRMFFHRSWCFIYWNLN